MNRHLEKLNNKPPHEKRRVAMQISAVLTSLLFLGWLGTLGPRLMAQIAPADAATASDPGASVSGVLASVGVALSGQWHQTQAMLTSVGSNPSWNGAATSSLNAPAPIPQPSADPATVIVAPDATTSNGADASVTDTSASGSDASPDTDPSAPEL